MVDRMTNKCFLERVWRPVLSIVVLAVLCAVFVKGVMILDANRHAKTYMKGHAEAARASYSTGYAKGWNDLLDQHQEVARFKMEAEERMKLLRQAFESGTTSGQIWMRNEN